MVIHIKNLRNFCAFYLTISSVGIYGNEITRKRGLYTFNFRVYITVLIIIEEKLELSRHVKYHNAINM